MVHPNTLTLVYVDQDWNYLRFKIARITLHRDVCWQSTCNNDNWILQNSGVYVCNVLLNLYINASIASMDDSSLKCQFPLPYYTLNPCMFRNHRSIIAFTLQCTFYVLTWGWGGVAG